MDPGDLRGMGRSRALIGTDPRVIADDVWAKLLHAGLNIEAADLPGTSAGSYYPGTALTKPVDPIIGQAIEAWQALRPPSPTAGPKDQRARRPALLRPRAHPVGKTYINRTIIPALCAKAGVPAASSRAPRGVTAVRSGPGRGRRGAAAGRRRRPPSQVPHAVGPAR